MEITAKHIGEIIAKHLNENMPNSFKVEKGERQIEITFNENWYKNQALFTTDCGEQMLYMYAWSNKTQKWEETSYMKCHRFLDNPVFWAGYVAGELITRKEV